MEEPQLCEKVIARYEKGLCTVNDSNGTLTSLINF